MADIVAGIDIGGTNTVIGFALLSGSVSNLRFFFEKIPSFSLISYFFNVLKNS